MRRSFDDAAASILLVLIALGVGFLCLAELGSGPPVAVVSGPTTAKPGELVEITSAGSSGSLEWIVKGGLKADHGSTVHVGRHDAGEIQVILKATRNGQSVSTPHTVRVGDAPPPPNPNPGPNPTPPTPPGPTPPPKPEGLAAWIHARVTSDAAIAGDKAKLRELAELYASLAEWIDASTAAGATPTPVEIRAATVERLAEVLTGSTWQRLQADLFEKKNAEGLGRSATPAKFSAAYREIGQGFQSAAG